MEDEKGKERLVLCCQCKRAMLAENRTLICTVDNPPTVCFIGPTPCPDFCQDEIPF